MNNKNLLPVKCVPAFKDYLWGGHSMKTLYPNLETPTPLAESWLLSANKDGESIIDNGEYKNLTFSEYLNKIGKSALGENSQKFDFFPVLIKFIDAKLPLSIQVHPDDSYGMKYENSYGKTEMWYIVDTQPDSFIYYGFSQSITKEQFEESIKNNTLLNYLNKVPVKKGDCFFIEAGTIHAICQGIVIAEVQQNSNITYRVYDYDRKDKDGNTRELHIKKAVDVTDLNKLDVKQNVISIDNNTKQLAQCQYFNTLLIEINGELQMIQNKDSFQSLICVKGSFELIFENESLNFSKGESIFIPANNLEYKLLGNGEILKTTV